MRKLKLATPSPAITTTFTRAEFALVADLVEDEAEGPAAALNRRYKSALLNLLGRLSDITSRADLAASTDAVKVVS